MEDTHYKSLLSILTCNLCKITQYFGQAAKIPTDFQKETCGRVFIYTEEKALLPFAIESRDIHVSTPIQLNFF